MAKLDDAQVLVIDEISMLDGRLLDKLDSLARNVRSRPAEPFGGIQLILAGDFFQLPPVRLEQGHNWAQPECEQLGRAARAALLGKRQQHDGMGGA